ncbi:MAG: hypothetical protein ABI867_35960 [Kofleriaceae bacterium]
MRLLVVLGLLAACERTPKRELDFDLIKPEAAQLRTDTVGAGQFIDTATFVLVDARNTATEGAYVTLAGELKDDAGKVVGELAPQSLWIPASEVRTFALVDSERKARPTAQTARAIVRGAVVLPPPLVHVEEVHSFDDHGQLVLKAWLVNEADRAGQAMVVATFYDGDRLLRRPFTVLQIAAKQDPAKPGTCPDLGEDKVPLASKCGVQFIGPPGATRGVIFVGDVTY